MDETASSDMWTIETKSRADEERKAHISMLERTREVLNSQI
jgi:hypothetical protein